MLKIVGTLVKISVQKDVGVLHIQSKDNSLVGLINKLENNYEIPITLETLKKYKDKTGQTVSIEVIPMINYHYVG
jgi:hypothetical protein